jgi:hypothetical protein
MLQVPADTLRAALDSVFAAPKYQWVARPHPWRWILEQLRRLTEWFVWLQVASPWTYWAVVIVTLVTLVAILVHAGWLMSRTMRHATPPDAHSGIVRAERRDGAWYRAQALRLAGAGRFPEAMRAWFEGMILDLAAGGLVQWHPSKTPREYVREAKLPAVERERLRALVDGVYDASFAGTLIGPPEWERWRRDAMEVGHGA